MKAIVFGAAMLALGGLCGTAGAAEPVTHQEIVDLPLDKLGPRVVDQLSEVLEARRERDLGGREPQSVYLQTRAYPLGPEFCRVDVLDPVFSPPYQARMSIDPARPSTAVGFSARHYFVKLREGQTCSQVDDLRLLYEAPDSSVAYTGYRVLETAIRQAPDKGFPIRCPMTDPKTCATDVGEIDPGRLRSISRCETKAKDAPWPTCLIYFVGGKAVRIDYLWPNLSPKGVAHIVSVEMLMVPVE